MNITQNRYKFGNDFTLSRISINGQPFTPCQYVLEDKVREIPDRPVADWKIPRETAIPVGRYQVVIDHSQRFNKPMLHLLDVPGYAGVRIHAGNTSHDTEGCLITGKERDEKHGEVSGSRIALAALFAKIESALIHGESVWWEVVGLPND